MTTSTGLAEHYVHTALDNPRATIRLCRFVSRNTQSQSDRPNLEIAHYSIDNIADYDYLDEEGVLYSSDSKEGETVTRMLNDGSGETVRYTAISYCWGSDATPRLIRVNGNDFGVSDNLYQLLVVLAGKHEATDTHFWIDQLCINQLDVNERNNQVNRMSLIYSGAEAVYVWLGAEDSDTSLAFDTLERLKGDNQSGEVVPNGDTPGRQMEAILAVVGILTRQYWTRLWVVQEVALAKNLNFLCGPYTYHFDSDNILTTLYTWENQLRGNESAITKAVFGLFYESTRLLSHCLNLEGSSDYILAFDAVESHGWRDCRDPRDRIFALQALVSPSRRVTVDYNKSTEEVFHEWFSETDPRLRHNPREPSDVLAIIERIHEKMGLGKLLHEWTVRPGTEYRDFQLKRRRPRNEARSSEIDNRTQNESSKLL